METTNIPDNTPSTTTNNPNKPKSWVYGILAILIIGGIIFAVNQGERKAPGDYSFDEIMSMPAEKQKSAFEAQVNDLEKRLTKLTQGTGDEAQITYENAKHRIYIKMAEAQNQLGRYQDALNSLNNIPESQKNNPDVLKAYALAYKGLGQNDQAIEFFKKAFEEDNTNVEVWLAYLDSSANLPNEELNALYRQAIPATKSNVDVMISYAKFSEKIGDKATAIAAWETARNVDPGNAAKYEQEIARLR